MQVPSNFRNIDTPSFKDFKPCSERVTQIVLIALRHVKPIARSWGRQTLFDHESVSMELPNYHVYPVSTFHSPAAVRESHPVDFTRLGRGALAQLPDLFQRWDHEFDAGLRVDQKKARTSYR